MRTLYQCLVCACFVALLAGCQVVDNFSGRAVGYNTQAEQAQLQALLLNIIRASLNRPMQFTSLSSVTGTASETGNATLSTPFGEATHRPKSVASPDVFGLSGTIAGGPTFTVPVLDTQEFYQGELTPITGKEINFFIEEGYTPAQLFYIFVDSVELSTTGDHPQHFTFSNHVGDDFDFDQFAAVADYLLSLGLTLESNPRVETIGPEFTAQQVSNLRDIADASNAGLTLAQAIHESGAAGSAKKSAKAPRMGADPAADPPEDKPARKSAKSRAARSPAHYELHKTTTEFRPCFDSQVLAAAGKTRLVDPTLICESHVQGGQGQSDGSLSRSAGIIVNDLSIEIHNLRANQIAKLQAAATAAGPNTAAGRAELEAAEALARLPDLPPDTKLQFKFVTRSTEAIMYYLGSVVARHLYPGSDRALGGSGTEPRMIQVKVGEPYIPYPEAPCPATRNGSRQTIENAYTCDNLFVVETGTEPRNVALSVAYQGTTYWIPGAASQQGRTMRLMDLVKQLLALHTSAKELPASNVLNVIGGP